jgi:hypothetical protein
VSVALESVNESGYLAAHSACAPLVGVRREDPYDWRSCSEFNASVLDFIRKDESIDTVILAARWPLNATGKRPTGEGGPSVTLRLADGESTGNNSELMEIGLRNSIKALTDLNRTVILLGGVPEIGWDVPKTIASSLLHGSKAPVPPTLSEVRVRQDEADQIFQRLGTNPKVHVVSIAQILCRPVCTVLDGTRPVYVDDDHVSVHGAVNIIGPSISSEIRDIYSK